MKTRLQEIRKAAGYKSARAFAEQNGLNVRTYTHYEQGTRMMDAEVLWMLADIFGCTMEEIIGRVPPAANAASQAPERISRACDSLNDEGVARLIQDAEILVNSGMFDKE